MNQSSLPPSSLFSNNRFIDWVRSPTPELDQYWQQWLIKNPHRADELAQAQRLLRGLQTDKTTFSTQDQRRLYEKLAVHSQKRTHTSVSQTKVRTVNYWRPIIGIAASVLLAALLIGFLIRNSVPSETVVATQYGETREFTLPDGTDVFLNANSTIRYAADETPREVWLEGEAYFQVVKQKNAVTKRADDFKVHTKNLTVRVLGTRFVVDSRKEQVVLDEGKVEVQPRTDYQSHLSLAPGEMAVLNQKTNQIKITRVNSYDYIAWKDNQLIFDETPLYEIAQLLEERYGYEVKFADPATRQETFNGTFPADDLQILFRTLKKSMSLEIKDKVILINE